MKRLGGCITSVIVFNILLGGVATKYVVEFWGSLFRGAPVDVPFWVAAVEKV